MSFTHEELLQELPRLKKICMGFTRREEVAEDLCQTILVMALERQDENTSFGLDHWLKDLIEDHFQDLRRQALSSRITEVTALRPIFSSKSKSQSIYMDCSSYEELEMETGESLSTIQTCSAHGYAIMPEYQEDPEVDLNDYEGILDEADVPSPKYY